VRDLVLSQAGFNYDIDMIILSSKVDSAENKQVWTYHKTTHAKSGMFSNRINFRKQYFYIDVGVKDGPLPSSRDTLRLSSSLLLSSLELSDI